MQLLTSPAFLLLSTGALLGLIFPFGKMASQADVSPVVWAFIVTVVPALTLMVGKLLTRKQLGLNIKHVKYYFIAALVSLVIPNVLTFSVIPRLGSGFTGLLFTLSPILTLVFSSVWHVRVPNALGSIAIVFGFVGAVLVAVTRGELNSSASIWWTLAGIGIPLSLAIGNVYRTLAWPKDSNPFDLALGVNLAAAIILLIAIVILPAHQLPGGVESIKFIATVAALAASIMAVLHFRLQFYGGPTFLSQISYLAAAVALAFGTVFFNEQYALLTWIGAVLIVIGTMIGIVAQKKR